MPGAAFELMTEVTVRASQFFVVALALFVTPAPIAQQPTVWMIGDSTMADKPNPEFNPERGWGQSLPPLLTAGVVVRNMAVNGRSTKSFIDEGKWAAVERELKPGDVVFIQFGHNDEKKEDPTRFADADGAYRANLERFVRQSRAKGAVPILCTSIARRKFDASGALTGTHGRYPIVTREVAAALGVPLLELELGTSRMIAEAGVEGSKALFVWTRPGEFSRYPQSRQDDTHLSPAGAGRVAQLAVDQLRALGLPALDALLR